MSTVENIIKSFGKLSDFGRACGYDRHPGQRAWDMRRRRNIPSRYWTSILRDAQRRGLDLTADMLIEAHSGDEARAS